MKPTDLADMGDGPILHLTSQDLEKVGLKDEIDVGKPVVVAAHGIIHSHMDHVQGGKNVQIALKKLHIRTHQDDGEEVGTADKLYGGGYSAARDSKPVG